MVTAPVDPRRARLIALGQLLYGRGPDRSGWQRELARKIGWSPDPVSAAASGKRAVSDELAEKLLELAEAELAATDRRRQELTRQRDELAADIESADDADTTAWTA